MSGPFQRRTMLRLAVLLLTALGAVAAEAGRYRTAFPGADGYGSRSKGGRGGRVLIVDSLEDRAVGAPAGTLRWAIRQPGPRIVVFRVAGTIELADVLSIREPYLTVAGQTAPGEGITVRGFPLRVFTHNVILQGIRSRLGAENLASADALNINGPRTRHVIVDHCSLSWSTDEVVAANRGARKVTIQRSIVSEALDCSTHPEGCHSAGLLLRDGSRKITLRLNLFAHNDYRNPKLVGDPDALGGRRADFEFLNNVVYDWRSWALAGSGAAGVNVEGNVFRTGPSTVGYPRHPEVRSIHPRAGFLLWLEGNVGPSCPAGCADDWSLMAAGSADELRAASRLRTPSRVVLPALEAFDRVVAEAGASYRLDEAGDRVPRRDAVDRRLVRELLDGTGRIIDDPAAVGGWPELDPGVPVPDADLDGMPDPWERMHGLDPNDASDARANPDGDLYSNVEEYLFELDPHRAEAPPFE